jgi:hypothetical protein
MCCDWQQILFVWPILGPFSVEPEAAIPNSFIRFSFFAIQPRLGFGSRKH